ncbi:MAG: hypothetical protein IKI60_03960 [Alloprevotella sp.]|nr:hypothetical protein [Alloprevotella sp.]
MLKRILLLAFLLLPAAVFSQQQQIQRRSVSLYERPSYERARIVQYFGREVKEDVNIYLKDASLCFIRDGLVYRANVDKVLGVKFHDAEYKNVNGQFGQIVAEKNNAQLIRVTTIDMARYEAEFRGDENTEYLEIPDIGVYMKLHEEAVRNEDKGYPLKEAYYFYVKGKFVPAVESKLKKIIKTEKKKEFRKLMGEKYWSLKDFECLKELLDFF